jgi:hypothetical protein
MTHMRIVLRGMVIVTAVALVGSVAGCSTTKARSTGVAAPASAPTVTASPTTNPAVPPATNPAAPPATDPAVSPATAQAAEAKVVQACHLLATTNKSLAEAYQSPWVRAVVEADDLVSQAAEEDPSWVKISGALAALSVAQPPGAALPPRPVTAAVTAAYWAKYAPLVAACAQVHVTLPAPPHAAG